MLRDSWAATCRNSTRPVAAWRSTVDPVMRRGIERQTSNWSVSQLHVAIGRGGGRSDKDKRKMMGFGKDCDQEHERCKSILLQVPLALSHTRSDKRKYYFC